MQIQVTSFHQIWAIKVKWYPVEKFVLTGRVWIFRYDHESTTLLLCFQLLMLHISSAPYWREYYQFGQKIILSAIANDVFISWHHEGERYTMTSVDMLVVCLPKTSWRRNMKYLSLCHQKLWPVYCQLLSANSRDGHHGNKYYWFGITFLYWLVYWFPIAFLWWLVFLKCDFYYGEQKINFVESTFSTVLVVLKCHIML